MDKKNGKKELALTGQEPLNPFGIMRRFTKDMERLFEDFGGVGAPGLFSREFVPFGAEFGQIGWVPQIEVTRSNGNLKFKADLPGLTKEDIHIELTDEALTISGERKEEKTEQGEGFYRSERSYGRFYRRIPLPEGAETEKALAVFNNGVLEVTMPVPKAEPEARKLEITEAPTEVKQSQAATA